MTQTVAMVGAGQLARMTQQAAISLGVRLIVLADSEEDPAVVAGARPHLGSAAALEDLRAIARGMPVLTFDHEQVDPAALAALESEGVTLAPSAAAHLFAQDKLHQRRELAALGFPVPPFRHATTAADAQAFGDEYGWPLVGKLPRGGYDGKGVFRVGERRGGGRPSCVRIRTACCSSRCWTSKSEIAVLVARSRNGEIRTYPVIHTVQVDGMLRELIVPAPVQPATAERAIALAHDIAERIDATGIMALELFVTARRTARQRARAAPAQLRALDDRGSGDLAVREPSASGARMAARGHRADRGRRRDRERRRPGGRIGPVRAASRTRSPCPTQRFTSTARQLARGASSATSPSATRTPAMRAPPLTRRPRSWKERHDRESPGRDPHGVGL